MCVRRGEIGAARWFVLHFINDCFKNVRTPFLPISIATVYSINYTANLVLSLESFQQKFFSSFLTKKKQIQFFFLFHPRNTQMLPRDEVHRSKFNVSSWSKRVISEFFNFEIESWWFKTLLVFSSFFKKVFLTLVLSRKFIMVVFNPLSLQGNRYNNLN